MVRDGLYWCGYLVVAFFYSAMFYLGISGAREDGQPIQETLLAGRSLPLSVALLTMTATWGAVALSMGQQNTLRETALRGRRPHGVMR